ncbi:MAG TPA: hypothetical protein VKU38_16805 [Ktedonobacteraceae bacterium]|nr:hypothetical protein [Ktedonobacteraceae bacterium]
MSRIFYRTKGKEKAKGTGENCPLPFAVTKLRTLVMYYLLSYGKVFFAVGKGLLTF